MMLVLTTLMTFPVATALPVSIIASPGFSETEFSPVVASTPDSLSTTASFVLSTATSVGGVFSVSAGGVSVFSVVVVALSVAPSSISVSSPVGGTDSPFSGGGGVSALSAGGGVVSVVAGGGVVSSPSASTKSVGAVLKETLNARSNAKRPFPNLCCKEFEYICNECF